MSGQKLSGADQRPLHSDAELMQRWLGTHMRRPEPRLGRGIPLWSKVSEVFCIGSTSAKEVCARHDCDPDKMVRRGQ